LTPPLTQRIESRARDHQGLSLIRLQTLHLAQVSGNHGILRKRRNFSWIINRPNPLVKIVLLESETIRFHGVNIMKDSRRGSANYTLIVLLIGCSLASRAAGSETVLVNFEGVKGENPYGRLVMDKEGNLYGTTFTGGTHGAGNIFKLDASDAYSEQVLYDFEGNKLGGFPKAGVILDASGNLYGTTTCGGSSPCPGGNGVAFKLSADGYEVLYTFTGANDGGVPFAPLVFDGAMNLWGTTTAGGTGACLGHTGCGVVFELTAASGYHTEMPIYTFRGASDGGVPVAPVIFNAAGTELYGTTFAGGAGSCAVTKSGCGVVFQLSPSGSEKVLHSFTSGSDGSLPLAPVVFDSTGTILYGTASAGGNAACSGGCGVVFSLSGDLLTTFHTILPFSGANGSDPTGGLAVDTATAALYGTTFTGGKYDLGVVFELQPGTREYSLLHSFEGSPKDGANPYAGLVLASGEPRLIPPPTKGGCPPSCGGTVNGGAKGKGTAFGAGP
jgi:uncharacterized repeat protein (TIGR03803 family)